MSHLIRFVSLLLLLCAVTGVYAQDSGEWQLYENVDFSLAYPATWELTETDQLVELSTGDYALNILREDLRLGLPAGDFERRKFIGQYGIPVDALVYDGKTKQVLYARLEGPNTILSIVLAVQERPDIAYEDIAIPRAVVEEASHIVSTLRLHAVQQPSDIRVVPFFSGEHNPIDAWQTYSHPTEPFGFRYPASWTLAEEAGHIILARDDVRFVIAYRPSYSQTPSVNSDLWNNDHREERPAIYGLHQAIPSQALNPLADGTAAGVAYEPIMTPDNYFVMWISADTRLDTITMDEVDLIISTFKTRPFQHRAPAN